MGERDDPRAPGRRLAGGQAPGAALAPGEPAARSLPAHLPGPVHLPGDEVAAQAASGAVRYDITCDPGRDRWYLDASWRTSPAPAAALDELRADPVVAVDVNPGHLAVAVVTADGNVLGTPVTIGLDLAGLPAATRDGRLRAAISTLIAAARRMAPERSSSRTSTSPRPGPKDASAPATGPPAAGAAGTSGGWSPASRPGSSETGWCRWPPTRDCRSSSLIRLIPPDGRPSTGSPHCGNTTHRRPVTTRQRW